MESVDLVNIVKSISNIMDENKDYLIELDAQNGDGDLGISMSNGFKALVSFLENNKETDIGKVFMKMGSAFNEASPSSLGTILSFGMIGMAKSLKGKNKIELIDIAQAFENGIKTIMDKADSKLGEKTILDSLYYGAETLKNNSNLSPKEAFEKAFKSASEGSENTKNMKAVHGRASYYGDKSIGILDGGSVVGKLIFEGIYNYYIKIS
ncbi:dihydroxyacetone kinase subunit L [Brachyspira sp.]|uniref:dihydroxyacetone kinase subunit L n=1 Tax=Brachyspira sp. TaxID=1977261 RepID=UPI003D7CDAF7